MLSLSRSALLFAAVTLLAGSAPAAVVFSNNIGGDAFTNAGTSGTGQAIGASNWYYNNVRNNGIVGINSTFARSGNGSAYMETTQGPGGFSSKADVELMPTATANGNGNFNSTSAMGRLANLSSFGYDWYRASTSTTSSIQHPSLRVQVVSADLTQFGYLVFERAYNGFGNAPTNTWQTDDIYANAATYNLWATGSIANAFTYNTENMLLTATIGGNVQSYSYDPLGRRKQKFLTGPFVRPGRYS